MREVSIEKMMPKLGWLKRMFVKYSVDARISVRQNVRNVEVVFVYVRYRNNTLKYMFLGSLSSATVAGSNTVRQVLS